MRAIPSFHRHLRRAVFMLDAVEGAGVRLSVIDLLGNELEQSEATFIVRLAIEIRRVQRHRLRRMHEISPGAVLEAARARIESRRRHDRLEVRARISA